MALCLGACGPGNDEPPKAVRSPASSPSPSPATPAPAMASATPGGTAPAAACTDGTSSPDTFDPSGGRYAVYLTGLNTAGRRLAFDLIQFLTGEKAVAAYHEDNPSDPEGPPNDYYIVNRSRATRAVPVVPRRHDPAPAPRDGLHARPRPRDLGGAAGVPGPNRPPEGRLLSYHPFWLTVRDSVVTEICEQYVP